MWAVAAAVVATLTRNPLYLSILLAVAALQYAAAARGSAQPQAAGWRALLRIALGLALLVIPFNALSAHSGSHVLLRLPRGWPVIGGPITLEAVLWGVTSALALLALIVLFATFNLRVNQAQMLRLTPAFLYEAGLVISIALTFIPQMMLSAREIHEAQLIRGYRMRRARDMLPLVMALLTTGLERSFQLAESMEARGFGNVRAVPRSLDVLFKLFSLAGLGGLLGGAFVLTYLPAQAWIGWAGLVASTLLLGGVFLAQGRRVVRRPYRRDRWTWADLAGAGGALAVLAAVIGVRLTAAAALHYYPYTTLLPPFQPWLGAALLLLALPAVL